MVLQLSSLFQNVPVVVAGRIGFGKDMWGMTASEISDSFKVSDTSLIENKWS